MKEPILMNSISARKDCEARWQGVTPDVLHRRGGKRPAAGRGWNFIGHRLGGMKKHAEIRKE
jgi:hypothetical protein